MSPPTVTVAYDRINRGNPNDSGAHCGVREQSYLAQHEPAIEIPNCLL